MGSASSTLFDALHDRILILNRAGKVVYCNSAARGDFDGTLSALLIHRDLRAAVARVVAQRDGPVQRIKIAHSDGEEAQISVTGAPNGTDVAVVVHASASTSDTPSIEARTVAEVMRQHLYEPLSAFVRALAQSPTTNGPAPLKEQGAEVLERLEKVMDLLAVFGGEALIGDERLLPKALVESACQECLKDQSKVRVVMTGFEGDLPPVYGASRWLLRALREIIDNAIGAGNSLSITIEIRAQQSGEYLNLKFLNHGVMDSAVLAQKKFVPFAAARATTASRGVATRIGLPLAQRIVELHGGSLRVRTDNDAGNTEVTVQLPTGAPKLTANQLDTAQVRRHAEDLAVLMARRRGKKAEPAQVDVR